MSSEKIDKTELFAKKYYLDSSLNRWIWAHHIRLVRKYALELGKIENCDLEVLEIAALLHDIGKINGREGHAQKSCELSKDFIDSLEFSTKQKELILKCMLKHSGRYSHEDNEIEVKVIQCSDALAILFDDVWQEHCRKTKTKEELLFLFDKMKKKINLESAREIAKPKLKELRYSLK
ncbi:HD domain-containing protein [Candidatus Woesearchaeota archaeon]|jgi:HD superfamily phosphodiesterase|nr:HD domain-containing protein [Candidatus Woesearchaeota archaeon]MBT6518733.1 HD domain-containing protein [Candidatus Woesearchaeota archaeon]MBT7367904.1 HD domain-containing protein [Candidatus Woesearchaeota archaeon]